MSATLSADSTGRHASRRIAVDRGEEPRDWQGIYDHLCNQMGCFSQSGMNATVVASTFVGLFSALAVLGMAIQLAFPAISIYLLAGVATPPAFLVGAAAGQAGGNLYLKLWSGLDDASRRGFATRLTLARTPAEWPDTVCRWLFTGDWMSSPVFDSRLPYVRIFIMGESPATCKEEDELWREIHATISGDSLFEAGANHREISYPRELPGWAKQVDKGDGIEQLKKRLGDRVATEWVEHMWKRAYRQWPALAAKNFPADARRECFELHSLMLQSGRDALVVVMRPDLFAAELAENAKDARRAA
ncbi:MAG: hypothetical protein LIP23_10205 [Planctomycetes bacterium]|nr:hypothetical protein [Planctomycetota bacterium]